MIQLRLVILFCALISLALVPPPAVAADANGACPVTTPPNPPFVPPVPFKVNTGPSAFWYGTNELWTWLEVEGVLRDLPRRDKGYFTKLFLWHKGYDVRKDPQPDIIVVLKRLDVEAPLVALRGGTNAFVRGGWGMLTGVTIPSEGCWEVTSYYDGHTMAFVVSVQH